MILQAIWKRSCKVRCPSVTILAVTVLFVEEVATEGDENMEDSPSTGVRILKDHIKER